MTPRFVPTKHDGIFEDSKSGIYYLRDTVYSDELRGEWIDRSLKTRQITQALDRAKLIRMKRAQGAQLEAGRRHSFAEVFDLLEKLQAPKAKGTSEQTRAIVKHLRWFEDKCQTVDLFQTRYEGLWADYNVYNQAQEKPRKLEHDRRYLVMALKRAFKAGWIKKEFKKDDFPLNEVTEPIGQYIEDSQVQAILSGLDGQPNTRLQVLMAVTMGMRISEILHLHRDEVDLKRREIDLNPNRVKTRKRREVPIPIADDVFEPLSEAYAVMKRASGQYVFPAVFTSHQGQPVDWNQPQDDNRYHWNRIRKELGIDPRFHDLRHTAITNALKAGVPDIAVRKIMGVSERTMRRIYAHIEGDMKLQFRSVFRGKFK